MLRYDKFTKGLIDEKRKITRRSMDWQERAVAYVCQGVASGQSIEELVSEDGQDARPTFEEFARFSLLEKYASKVAESESLRVRRFQEKLVKALNTVFEDASSENIEILKNTGQALERMLKNQGSTSVVLNVTRFFPDSFWKEDFNEDIEENEGFLDDKGN